jgi:predicted transposase YbfD/YdcC
MQSTSSPLCCAIAAAVPPAPGVDRPESLLAAFATVPDPRRRQGTRFGLPALLALAASAILANHLSVLAMAQWAAAQPPTILAALGFPDGVTPQQSTLQRLFRKLDPTALSAALSAYFAGGPAARPEPARGARGVAMDGKAQRGRLLGTDATAQAVHALSLCAHCDATILAQVPIVETGAQVEAELTVAPALLARIDWRGRVLTGDALFCQRHLCEQVLDAGGDYLVTVKDNQPTLHEAIRFLFDPPGGPLGLAPLTDRREARQVDKGHGRLEVRHLIASTDLVGYLDWPGLAQVFRVERTWRERGRTKRAVRYGLTSLPPTVADAARLLALRRGHWTIENRLHYVSDVTLREDASRVRRGAGPLVLAWLRHAALTLLRRAGYHAIAERLRYHSVHPEAAIALLGISLPQNA